MTKAAGDGCSRPLAAHDDRQPPPESHGVPSWRYLQNQGGSWPAHGSRRDPCNIYPYSFPDEALPPESVACCNPSTACRSARVHVGLIHREHLAVRAAFGMGDLDPVPLSRMQMCNPDLLLSGELMQKRQVRRHDSDQPVPWASRCLQASACSTRSPSCVFNNELGHGFTFKEASPVVVPLAFTYIHRYRAAERPLAICQ